MGLFHVGCTVVNLRTSRSVVVPKVLVDTGAEATWIQEALLAKAGIQPRKKDLQFQMANGQIITRSVGYAILRVGKAETVDEVVFAEPGDLQLLGCRALEGFNLKVDSRSKRLVAAGPTLVATAVPPEFGKLIRVPPRVTKKGQRAPRRRTSKRTVARRAVRPTKP